MACCHLPLGCNCLDREGNCCPGGFKFRCQQLSLRCGKCLTCGTLGCKPLSRVKVKQAVLSQLADALICVHGCICPLRRRGLEFESKNRLLVASTYAWALASFTSVCLSVCLLVCMSSCLSVHCFLSPWVRLPTVLNLPPHHSPGMLDASNPKKQS